MVVRQIDHATPQPAQRFTPEEFLKWVTKQLELAEKVYACYEAGFSGFGLARKLLEMGVECYVICPQNWDERSKGMKTDKQDARAMTLRLDRYVSGNHDALAIVQVPTVEEEQARCESRQREQLLRERERIEAQGRSLMMNQGIVVKGRWWKQSCWETLKGRLPSWIVERLEVWRPIVLLIDEKLQALTRDLDTLVCVLDSTVPGRANVICRSPSTVMLE